MEPGESGWKMVYCRCSERIFSGRQQNLGNEIGMSWDTKGLPKCSGSNHKRGGFYGI